jgi:hypothetical protein
VDTAYINHTSGVDFHEGTGWYLYENKLAAMHYQDLPIATDPDSFSEGHDGVGTLEDFIGYVENGVVLGVRNNSHPELQGGMLVGSAGPVTGATVPEQSMRIIVSRDGDPNDWQCSCEGNCTSGCSVVGSVPVEPRAGKDDILEAARKVSPEAHEVLQALVELREESKDEVAVLDGTSITLEDGSADGVTVLQAIKLNEDDTRWAWYRDFPAFATLQHRGTTNGWNKGSEQLIAAYQGVANLADSSESTTVELLSSGQLETLCSEYLRSQKYENYFHEYPAGGSLTAADVVARDGETGKRVISQVTFDGGKASKIRALGSYATEGEQDIDLWYFGSAVSDEDIPDEVREEINMKPIEEVFDEMEGTAVRESIMSVPTKPPTPGSE